MLSTSRCHVAVANAAESADGSAARAARAARGSSRTRDVTRGRNHHTRHYAQSRDGVVAICGKTIAYLSRAFLYSREITTCRGSPRTRAAAEDLARTLRGSIATRLFRNHVRRPPLGSRGPLAAPLPPRRTAPLASPAALRGARSPRQPHPPAERDRRRPPRGGAPPRARVVARPRAHRRRRATEAKLHRDERVNPMCDNPAVPGCADRSRHPMRAPGVRRAGTKERTVGNKLER
jgi:hypothetical protein